MIKIRRLEPTEWAAAKRVVYCVAHTLFNDPLPLEESIAYHEARHELKDMDDIQKNYFENGGVFLVMTDNDQIIGTGAIRSLGDGICELKRLWLLTEYQGKGLGYRMLQELLSIAGVKNYQRIRLETDYDAQKQAYNFYKRVGFYDIPRYTNENDDVAMEMIL